jgi:hypothetical protein
MAQMSEAKLSSWMQKLGPRLIALSAGICRDRHQAEEIVQEAFVKLWQQPPDAGEIAYPCNARSGRRLCPSSPPTRPCRAVKTPSEN